MAAVNQGAFYPYTNESEKIEEAPSLLLQHNIQFIGVGGEVRVHNAAIHVRGRGAKVLMRDIHLVHSGGHNLIHFVCVCTEV